MASVGLNANQRMKLTQNPYTDKLIWSEQILNFQYFIYLNRPLVGRPWDSKKLFMDLLQWLSISLGEKSPMFIYLDHIH